MIFQGECNPVQHQYIFLVRNKFQFIYPHLLYHLPGIPTTSLRSAGNPRKIWVPSVYCWQQCILWVKACLGLSRVRSWDPRVKCRQAIHEGERQENNPSQSKCKDKRRCQRWCLRARGKRVGHASCNDLESNKCGEDSFHGDELMWVSDSETEVF